MGEKKQGIVGGSCRERGTRELAPSVTDVDHEAGAAQCGMVRSPEGGTRQGGYLQKGYESSAGGEV